MDTKVSPDDAQVGKRVEVRTESVIVCLATCTWISVWNYTEHLKDDENTVYTVPFFWSSGPSRLHCQ